MNFLFVRQPRLLPSPLSCNSWDNDARCVGSAVLLVVVVAMVGFFASVGTDFVAGRVEIGVNFLLARQEVLLTPMLALSHKSENGEVEWLGDFDDEWEDEAGINGADRT